MNPPSPPFLFLSTCAYVVRVVMSGGEKEGALVISDDGSFG